ncbi:hypothetical protein [Streptomyces sp. KL116D]|uniref:hypothetical protein n=1 Tax=Streptomyces sp. KL116D TaxID=3045152 RepID=UPI00355749D5
MSDILWDDPHFTTGRHDSGLAYPQSKTANVLFTVELDRRWAADGIAPTRTGRRAPPPSTSRWVRTPSGPWALIDASGEPVSSPRARAERRPSSARRPSVRGRSPRLDGIGGVYLNNSDVSPLDDDTRPIDLTAPEAGTVPADVAPHSIDPGSARRLWELSERLIARPSGGTV